MVEGLANIDRKYIYILLVIVISVPIFRPMKLPVVITPQETTLYDVIRKMPKDKIAIVCVDYGVGTDGENGPQTKSIIRALFQHNKPFVVMAWGPEGVTLGEGYAKAVAKQMHKKYGVDWCSWGMCIDAGNFMMGMAKDVKKMVRKDTYGTPIGKVPMMRNVKDINDIGLVTVSTGGWGVYGWIQLIGSVYGTPIGYAPTAVMVPEGYNPLDAKQICGMLPGMAGAAAFEKMNHVLEKGTVGTDALSTSHILIIILIILGNIGMAAGGKRKAAERRAAGGSS